MKKILLALLIAVIVAGGAFAVDFKMSAGVGGLMSGQIGGGGSESSVSGSGVSMKITTEYTDIAFGAYAFFDATFVEVTAAYFFSAGVLSTSVTTTPSSFLAGTSSYVSEMSGLNLGLFGKFPFALGDKFRLFPLVGIDYQVVTDYLMHASGGSSGTLVRNGKNIPPSDFSSLWFKGGIGADVSFTDAIYARLEALFGVGLPSKYATDTAQYAKDLGMSADTTIATGYTIRIAVGYSF
jgi:hypothetical protein